jgi:putative transcriptional regulator
VPDDLAPRLLVAAPALRDPSFVRNVVVLVEHGAEGSLGFVVNRPAPVSFGRVAELLGLPSPAASTQTVFTGGPVTPQSGWILFDRREVAPLFADEAVTVTEGLAVSASRVLLEAIAKDEGPARRLLALGYCGWGPGQLDAELARGIWIPVDIDDEIVFDVPPPERWHAALTSAGIDPARMMRSGGGYSA